MSGVPCELFWTSIRMKRHLLIMIVLNVLPEAAVSHKLSMMHGLMPWLRTCPPVIS